MKTRRLPSPPAQLGDCVSRREAAQLLGFASEFPVRQLEKAGQLRAVRGAMKQAWYPRADVVALLPASTGLSASRRARTVRAAAEPTRERAARGRWTDDALIALLRQGAPAEGTGAAVRPRTAVDLVADTGISIARATRVYRFWLDRDVHPLALLARGRRPSEPAGDALASGAARPKEAPSQLGENASPDGIAGERRGSSRMERDGLIQALRDPDPAVRARAFEKLRPGRRS